MQRHEMVILAAALALAAALLLRRLLRPKAKERRHRRKQDQARRVLAKINTIPLMPQRLAYRLIQKPSPAGNTGSPSGLELLVTKLSR